MHCLFLYMYSCLTGLCVLNDHPDDMVFDVCFWQGGREVSDFISYLKREATNPVVVQDDEEKPKKKKKKSEL